MTKRSIPEIESLGVASLRDKTRLRAHGKRRVQRIKSELQRAQRRPRNDLSPDLRLERRPIASLIPGATIRVRDEVQHARIVESLRRYGVSRPVLISADGRIVEGHGVVEAAKALGIETVLCVVVDHLSPAELRSLRVTLNRTAETGAWDFEVLAEELRDLDAADEDLGGLGFEEAELDAILFEGEAGEGEEADDAIPPFPAITTSQPGDLWLLDEQRLLQGDARDPHSYELLFEPDERAALVFCDPPYNVPNHGHVTSSDRYGEFAMGHGEWSPPQFQDFLKGSLRPTLPWLRNGALVGVCMDWRSTHLLVPAGLALDLTLLNICVWTKTNGGQGSLWRSAYENCVFFKFGNAPHTNNVRLGRYGRNRTNVWQYAGGSSLGSDAREGLEVHPTVKPRALVEDALLDVTNRGDIIIDGFAGSGTTLIAAEAKGRRCRAIEIDGGYCDVILERWRAFTGRSPILAATGQTFDEVRRERSSAAGATPLTPNTSDVSGAPSISDR